MRIAGKVLADPKRREGLMKFVSSLDRDRKIADAGAFIEFLSSRPEVKGKRFGATGYCMGGNASLSAAGRLLGLPKATISRQLALMEQRMGAPLLLRSTKNVSTRSQLCLSADASKSTPGAIRWNSPRRSPWH